MKRKMIGVITAYPESIYQQRAMKGLFRQCRKYDYDVAVFSTLVHASHQDKAYLSAELNIFHLINFDLLDGIIVQTIPLKEDNTGEICKKLLNLLKNKCHKPVVTMDTTLGNYPCIQTDDIPAFEEIVCHLMDVHHCRNIYFLNGGEQYEVSAKRLTGFRNVFAKRDISFPEEHIFYGDFWYTSGEQLADRIASHEVAMPDAVVCASDHMAIGLINRLLKHGIQVPEQIRVTGFDATAEAAINEPAVTSYIPRIEQAAAEAVNYLHRQIAPDMPIFPSYSPDSGLTLCASCGCPENISYIKQRLSNSLLRVNTNYNNNELQHPDIYMLLEHYVAENLTKSQDPDDCLDRILHLEYLIHPYSEFWLCLRENWLDTDSVLKTGYPERMKTVLHADYHHWESSRYSESGLESFFTSAMLPQLHEEQTEPAVFYFTPVHFQEDSFGYTVLKCALSEERLLNQVYHNWIRYVNTALEMVRTKQKLTNYSEQDSMTGLLNRRGMERWISQKEEELSDKSELTALIFVIDMDGLKYINDVFGHQEGDFGIRTIAGAVETIINADTEICARIGGDEFLIIGIGKYLEGESERRIEKFYQHLHDLNTIFMKEYEISASIGSASAFFTGKKSIDSLMEQADRQMYQQKIQRKKNRN